jgi:hypothetical protein
LEPINNITGLFINSVILAIGMQIAVRNLEDNFSPIHPHGERKEEAAPQPHPSPWVGEIERPFE